MTKKIRLRPLAKQVLLCLLLINSAFEQLSAQAFLLDNTAIEERNEKLIKTYQKFAKKPGKKDREQAFVTLFNSTIEQQDKEYQQALQLPAENDLRWEYMLNSLHIRQYLSDMVQTSPEALKLVQAGNYRALADSVASIAADSLYTKGKKWLTSQSDPNCYRNAYRYFKRTAAIRPLHKDAQRLAEQALLLGQKYVSFTPILSDNTGNVFSLSWGSDTDNEIISSIIKNLSHEGKGSIYQQSPTEQTNYLISLKWVGLNMGKEMTMEYTKKRETERLENGQKIKKTATVNYKETTQNLTGTLECSITNAKTGAMLGHKRIKAFTSFNRLSAGYTGDREALTDEDLQVTDKSKGISAKMGKSVGEKINALYFEGAERELLHFLAGELNWN